MKWYVILILAVGINGCKNTESPDPIWQMTEIKRVKLKTGEKDVLMSTSFQFADDKIFISDLALGRQAFCFDLEGELVNEIGSTGQGPGEYAFAGGIFYADGVIRLGAGNKTQNIYSGDGVYQKSVTVPNLKEPTSLCQGPKTGDIFGTSFSRYVDKTIYHMDAEGTIINYFSPPDDQYGHVFDNYFPYGGIFRWDQELVQFFNHRYELIFWSLEGKEKRRVTLKSRKYVPPDYNEVVSGSRDEQNFRKSFSLFASAFRWNDGLVTVLRNWDDLRNHYDIIEFWDRDLQQIGRTEPYSGEELVDVSPKGELIFFKADDDISSIIFRIVSSQPAPISENE